MSTSGRNVVFLMSVLLSSLLAIACKRDEAPEKKAQPAASVEATTIPETAAMEAAAEIDPYDDSLVLLAEGEPDTGPAPLTVEFVVESLIADEISGAQYTWDFGDGSPKSNEANPTHTYEKPGEYTATIGIVDASGERGWDEVDIYVEEAEEQE